MLDLESLAPERLRPIRRVEYDRMVELGLFDDERVELLAGMLVTMSPQGSRHAEVICRLTRRLFHLDLQARATVRVQLPLALGHDAEPEPDLAVVPAADYARGHPTTALLVIEVAETSVRKDRRIKAALYAAHGIPEYWLVNLAEDLVEVRRDPADGAYATTLACGRAASIAPRSFPDIVIAVDEILPR